MRRDIVIFLENHPKVNVTANPKTKKPLPFDQLGEDSKPPYTLGWC